MGRRTGGGGWGKEEGGWGVTSGEYSTQMTFCSGKATMSASFIFTCNFAGHSGEWHNSTKRFMSSFKNTVVRGAMEVS